MKEEIDEVIEKALELVTPSEDEEKRAKEAEIELTNKLKKVLKDYPELNFRFLGSYPRNTWLRGNLELDVFILFPESFPMEKMEKEGLEIGKKVVDEYELRYAAHPYVHGKVKGVDVDIVPCYAVREADKIKSAVDRTPFHHDWLKSRIKGKESEVRLLKKFLKASNLYGAEYSVRGFSGYLCELLIIFFGSFKTTVEECRKLTRDTVIDVRKAEMRKDKSIKGLFVVDPVDEKRNVAANLSLDKLAKFVEKCHSFVENPTISFFEEKREEKVDYEVLKEEIKRRGTGIYLIKIEKPEIVEDNLYPQLERACRKIHEHLARFNFMPLRSSYFVDDACYLIFETEVRELPKIMKRMGPPFEKRKDVERFVKKRRRYVPFIEEGRYFVYDERKHSSAVDSLRDFIKREKNSLGKNLREKFDDFKLLEGEKIFKQGNEKFKVFLAKFLCLVEE